MSLFALPWPGQQHMVSQIPGTSAQEWLSNSVSSNSLLQARSFTAASFQTDDHLDLFLEKLQWLLCQVICSPAENPKSTAKSTAADKSICARLICPPNKLLATMNQTDIKCIVFLMFMPVHSNWEINFMLPPHPPFCLSQTYPRHFAGGKN